MKSPWILAFAVLFFAGVACWLTRPAIPALAVQTDKISRRHPAPPADLQVVNRQIGQSVADAKLETLEGKVGPLSAFLQAKPMVLVFFSHDCDCSLEFARYFEAAMKASWAKADWRFVFPNTPGQITAFGSKVGVNLPSLRDPGARLSNRLGITKSGPFVLVDSQGIVLAIWPGVSLGGFEDLFHRLNLALPSLPQLSGIPQSPTAGCPLTL
jgi:peroxiredoxin